MFFNSIFLQNSLKNNIIKQKKSIFKRLFRNICFQNVIFKNDEKKKKKFCVFEIRNTFDKLGKKINSFPRIEFSNFFFFPPNIFALYLIAGKSINSLPSSFGISMNTNPSHLIWLDVTQKVVGFI